MNFIRNETEQKLRGGYYTPLDLAIFLARWVKNIKPKNILEPSCGDGVFFNAIAKAGINKSCLITGVEFDKKEAALSRTLADKILSKSKVETGDFLQWALNNLRKGSKFDAVLGNPPFIRYQYLPKEFQEKSEEIFEQLNIKFTKHTNAWVPFILASVALLRPGGRIAMVVPAEIIHVGHAQALRSYLGKECRRIVIVDPEEIWFDNTLQGAVLLLAEKCTSPFDKNEGLGIYPVKGRDFLKLDPEEIFLKPKSMNGRTISGKWTYALLDPEIRELIDELSKNPNIHRFKDIADVDVGIVTGANEYFLVSDITLEKYNLSKWAHPMFGRSNHSPGVIYNKKQHVQNSTDAKPTNFIWFPDATVVKDKAARAYIKYGESQELHTRYKCSTRSPWYSVPSVYSTEIGMLKRSHDAPRLIFNKMDAFTTDTAYRIRSDKVSAEQLVGVFMNSLTALSAELEGRHYGGGVLELVPSEIERLLIPLPKNINIDLKELDNSVRTLPMRQILENQDRKILKALGISDVKQKLLIKNWEKLHNRRQRISSSEI